MIEWNRELLEQAANQLVAIGYTLSGPGHRSVCALVCGSPLGAIVSDQHHRSRVEAGTGGGAP